MTNAHFYFSGNSGLTYIIQVISRLLDPKTSEYTASFVGKLVTVVLSKVGGQLGDQMDLILRAVLSKMQQTETLSVMQVSDLSARCDAVSDLSVMCDAVSDLSARCDAVSDLSARWDAGT